MSPVNPSLLIKVCAQWRNFKVPVKHNAFLQVTISK
jgi:hypothetical protein